VTGNDTPVDSAVKARLVSGITAQKTGDATTDAAIQRAADTLKATKMSTIMAAAKDQDQLLHFYKRHLVLIIVKQKWLLRRFFRRVL
jgi:hypothetical protein